MLRLTFLGTSAAQPTIQRNLTGLAVRRERELFLVDCGEGTQRQMIRYGTGFDVDAIFFTHFHADHYLGAIGFLRTLSMLGREAPLDVYGPRPARRLLDVMLFTGTEKLAFGVRIHEVRPGDSVRRDGCDLVPFETDHRTPSVGWALLEDARPGRFHPEKAAALGVPKGPLFGALQHGREACLKALYCPVCGYCDFDEPTWFCRNCGVQWQAQVPPQLPPELTALVLETLENKGLHKEEIDSLACVSVQIKEALGCIAAVGFKDGKFYLVANAPVLVIPGDVDALTGEDLQKLAAVVGQVQGASFLLKPPAVYFTLCAEMEGLNIETAAKTLADFQQVLRLRVDTALDRMAREGVRAASEP